MRFRIAPPYRSFTKFLISYVILLLVGVTAETIVFSLLIRNEKEAIVRYNLQVLETSVERLEERLRALEDIVVMISDHQVYPNIAALLRRAEPPTSDEYFEYIQAVNRLPNYKLINSVISDYFIHLRKSRFIVSPGVGSGREEVFYQSHLAYAGLDVAQWIERMYQQFHLRTYWPAQNLGARQRGARYVTLLKSIPIESFVGYGGTVIFLIEEQQLLSFLDIVAGFGSGGVAYIQDRGGRLVASSRGPPVGGVSADLVSGPSHSETRIDGHAVSVVSVTSDYTGWVYTAVIRSDVFWRGLNRVRTLLIAVLLVTLAPGLGIAIGFSRRYSRALRRIATNLRGSGEDNGSEGDEYRFIESSVAKLVRRRTELLERLDEERPLVRSSFFDRLFFGRYTSLEEIESYLGYIDLDLHAGAYSVAVFRVVGYRGDVSEGIIKELTMASAATLDVLQKNLAERACCHTIEPGAVAVLYPSRSPVTGSTDEVFRAALRGIVGRLKCDFDMRVACGVGTVCHDLIEVSTSYHQALRCLGRGDAGDGDVVAFSDLSQDRDKLLYSIEDEVRLMNLVRAGASAEVTSLLRRIRQEGEASRRDPMIEHSLRMMDALRNTLARLEPDIASSSEPAALALSTCLTALDPATEPNRFYEVFESGLLTTCEAINRAKRSHNDLLREGIVAFVDSHYKDPMLNLAMVASEFHLAEKYLSKFFKEQTGENFSAHIETVRLGHARTLLAAHEHTVSGVSGLVGYGNPNTFHRAFKRVYGITPTEYRDSVLQA